VVLVAGVRAADMGQGYTDSSWHYGASHCAKCTLAEKDGRSPTVAFAEKYPPKFAIAMLSP
jgi:hypothetical protein